ncbi:A-kinase anchor protein SPHKAP isoform X3 [Pantherophis guttatus]|uniref:A-kinase anchor protein SPHKAP isoform X3 n=1 Tax=Pantherophis guttatus TaxID=94885 RepID=A0A6P9DGT9_PANGU|nr:A-kinase anchor protein SPHKAP isoform X3 [Pantherophis guttatus]
MAKPTGSKLAKNNFECPLMYEISHHGGTDNSVRSSVKACKKVLCSNSLLDSTDYWLQNQKTPCRIGIMEDKMDKNCTSVCFVNLDAGKADYNSEFMKQRLVNISPNLPKFIASMNVQPPKDNEIIFLSGLTSENLQADFEVSECSWLADICLLQCARGNQRKNTSCIIFEINKFLIGLELVQEKQLHIEATSLKLEDDTNCSVSSIEEDFLTASEHFEDEDDEYKQGEENLHLAAEFKKYREGDCEDLHCKKAQVPFFLKGSCISHDSTASTRSSESSEEEYNSEAEDNVLETVDEANKQLNWKVGKYNTTGKCKPLSSTDDKKDFGKSDNNKSENVCYTITTKEDVVLLDELATGQRSHLDTLNCRVERTPHPLIQNDQAPTGQFATNLAESVLQDAFIRLSQSTFTKETALDISVSNPLTSTACGTQNEMACRSWNALPKIVIVQSPDGSDKSEWPGSNFPSLHPWSEVEHSSGADFFQDNSPSKSTQSPLEVALACAATVIGTISSPHAAEKLREQESLNSVMTVGNREVEEKTSQSTNSNCNSVSYSFLPDLSDMAQMANVVAVHGLGEKKDIYPVTSSGLLSAAETSTAVTLHCSIAIGSTMENLNNSIAQVLFKEASLVLTRPHAYRTMGEFMESVNGKIVQAATKPSTALLDEIIVDELAQNLSNIILRHSVEEVRKKQHSEKNIDACLESTQDVFTATANQLLFNVFYFTCKKMNDITQLNECSNTFIPDTFNKQVMDCQPKETKNDVLHRSSSCSNNKLTSNFHDKDGLLMTNLVNNVKEEIVPNALESLSTVNAQSSLSRKTSSKKRYLKRITKECCRPVNPNSNYMKAELSPFSSRENQTLGSEGIHGLQEFLTSSVSIITENHEEPTCDAAWHNERQLSVPFLGNQGILPTRPLVYLMHPADKYCITDFAEELAETVVSMATEIAAICLDNSNGKQPWFCAWQRGSDYLMPQALPCRSMKRKKETQTSGSTVRKHRPPRLSEIKRKTDEHPELKEWLMNRVVDDSINLDDTLDLSTNFANEAAAKIMNLAEFSVADNVWQNPSHPQNRLHCDRWNRVNASSCESIPEEDLDSKGSINTLALINTLGQSISRTSSVSKQSSCESITDEFSRFMVNQMETEGREFDLLLDYYAGKNANNIITSALQQVTKKNGHLNVKPSCPSKQSSTESITEEFYRYMLREIEKEHKEKVYSAKNAKEWSSSLLLPSQRSSFCFRQSSVPDNRSSTSRLTVNMPIKANSLDGFSRSGHGDSLTVYPVNTASSSGLCKSDSYLYQRCRTDQVTDMLIHETWANSIKALMCKNKIILDSGEVAQPEQHPPHVQQYAHRLAANIVESGKTLIAVHQDSTKKDHVTESIHSPSGMQNNSKPFGDRRYLDEKEQQASFPGLFSIKPTSSSSCLREVPLIQIETDQRQHLDNASEPLNGINVTSSKAKEDLLKGKPIDADSGQQLISSNSHGLTVCSCPESEASVDNTAVEEFPVPLSSSEESTCSSWCQLANNPDDTSSYLQLSERSMSNGNSSTSSSLGIMDLEIYQENIPSSHAFNDLTEGGVFCEKLPEKIEAGTSGLTVETTNEQKDLLVINVDLEPEYPDAELRATLQWIAASEFGIPMIYFKKSQEHRIEKFLDVVQFVHQKCWKVGDIFHAVVQFCKLHEESKGPTLSLFDWLLELG